MLQGNRMFNQKWVASLLKRIRVTISNEMLAESLLLAIGLHRPIYILLNTGSHANQVDGTCICPVYTVLYCVVKFEMRHPISL
jgi:hypothetical protein